MSQPPLDESWQEPQAIRSGRSNQAKSHYRPRQVPGRVTPSRSQATSRSTAPVRRAVNHRRVWFFTIALLLALAFGAALFKAVMAGPPPTAHGPARPAPVTTVPSTPTPVAPSTPTPVAPSTPTLEEPAPDPMRDGEAAADVEKTEAPHARKPRPAPTTPNATPSTVAVQYKNCGQARKAGAAPIRRDAPGYSSSLDSDGNGVACETGKD